MGKFVNQKGKIRILTVERGGITYYVCRKGNGVFVAFSIDRAIGKARIGDSTKVRHNYELINRIVKNNPILKLRDQQPDGLLILQTPIQGKLPL